MQDLYTAKYRYSDEAIKLVVGYLAQRLAEISPDLDLVIELRSGQGILLETHHMPNKLQLRDLMNSGNAEVNEELFLLEADKYLKQYKIFKAKGMDEMAKRVEQVLYDMGVIIEKTANDYSWKKSL